MITAKDKTIGIDLGGTKVNVGLVQNNEILSSKKQKLPKNCKDEWDVLNLIISLTKDVIGNHNIAGIEKTLMHVAKQVFEDKALEGLKLPDPWIK